MCEEFKEFKVFLEIIEVKGYCDHKHCVGEKMEVSITNTGGLCGTFYAAVLQWITIFQYGGNIPFSLFQEGDKDVYTIHCPDAVNMVSARMTREFYRVWDDAEIQRMMDEAAQNNGQET